MDFIPWTSKGSLVLSLDALYNNTYHLFRIKAIPDTLLN